MKKLTKLLAITLVVLLGTIALTGCGGKPTSKDIKDTQKVGDRLAENQPSPTDINYSLERYNLIRRAYWVNGQREKAINLPCPVAKPLGYVVLLTPSGAVVGRFIVDGKITSLNSFLTPNMVQEYYKSSGVVVETELPDIDGSYGTNDNGIFFFTPNGQYIEWNGIYIYSDIPFEVDNPILNIGGGN